MFMDSVLVIHEKDILSLTGKQFDPDTDTIWCLSGKDSKRMDCLGVNFGGLEVLPNLEVFSLEKYSI